MLRRIIFGLRTLVRRTAVDQELNEELRSHIDRAIARNVERGMTAVAARHAAQREFGNFMAAAEDARAAWQWRTWRFATSDAAA